SIERAARGELGAQIAPQALDGAAAEKGLEELEIEVPGQGAREGPAVEPPFDAQVAAVGGEVRLVERDVIAGDVDVDRAGRLDAHPLHGGLAVGTVDGAGDREPELGEQHVERQRLAGIEIDGHAPAGHAAPVAERDQLGGQRVQLEAAEGDAPVHAGPFGEQGGVDVDVEAIEELAVNGDAGRALGPHDGRRQRQVPLAELDAAHDDVGQIDVAVQLGPVGPAAQVQLRADEAAHRHARVGRAGDGRDRDLRQVDVEVEILVGEADPAVRLHRAAAPARHPKALDEQ